MSKKRKIAGAITLGATTIGAAGNMTGSAFLGLNTIKSWLGFGEKKSDSLENDEGGEANRLEERNKFDDKENEEENLDFSGAINKINISKLGKKRNKSKKNQSVNGTNSGKFMLKSECLEAYEKVGSLSDIDISKKDASLFCNKIPDEARDFKISLVVNKNEEEKVRCTLSFFLDEKRADRKVNLVNGNVEAHKNLIKWVQKKAQEQGKLGQKIKKIEEKNLKINSNNVDEVNEKNVNLDEKNKGNEERREKINVVGVGQSEEEANKELKKNLDSKGSLVDRLVFDIHNKFGSEVKERINLISLLEKLAYKNDSTTKIRENRENMIKQAFKLLDTTKKNENILDEALKSNIPRDFRILRCSAPKQAVSINKNPSSSATRLNRFDDKSIGRLPNSKNNHHNSRNSNNTSVINLKTVKKEDYEEKADPNQIFIAEEGIIPFEKGQLSEKNLLEEEIKSHKDLKFSGTIELGKKKVHIYAASQDSYNKILNTLYMSISENVGSSPNLKKVERRRIANLLSEINSDDKENKEGQQNKISLLKSILEDLKMEDGSGREVSFKDSKYYGKLFSQENFGFLSEKDKNDLEKAGYSEPRSFLSKAYKSAKRVASFALGLGINAALAHYGPDIATAITGETAEMSNNLKFAVANILIGSLGTVVASRFTNIVKTERKTIKLLTSAFTFWLIQNGVNKFK